MIDIEICMGTACYVLGSGDLLDLHSNLPEQWKKEIRFIGCNCGEWCQNTPTQAPYVRIDGELYSRVTPEVLMEKIKERML